jgi:hypothetical protein
MGTHPTRGKGEKIERQKKIKYYVRSDVVNFKFSEAYSTVKNYAGV